MKLIKKKQRKAVFDCICKLLENKSELTISNSILLSEINKSLPKMYNLSHNQLGRYIGELRIKSELSLQIIHARKPNYEYCISKLRVDEI